MHCSTCGRPVNHGLSFCNHCGARLSESKEHNKNSLSESSLNALVGGMLGIPIAGLVLIIALMTVMKKELGFSNGVVIACTFLSFLLLLAAEAVLIWLLVQRTRAERESHDPVEVKDVVTRELGDAHMRGLPEPAPSVIENTTRTLEPIHRESKTE